MQRSVKHIFRIVSGFIIFVPVRKSMEVKASVLHMSINITIITRAEWFLEIGLKVIASARGVTTALRRPLSMYRISTRLVPTTRSGKEGSCK